MPGGSYLYRCDRCPLIIEVGGGVEWDGNGRVVLEQRLVACAACGTMHRLTERDGVCRVTAFPGPVRGMRASTVPDGLGGEVETSEFAVDGDVKDIGELPGGLAALDRPTCGHCPAVGRVETCADLRAPGGGYRVADCPLCGGPLDGVGLSDWI